MNSVGIDIVENERIKQKFSKNFLKQILTENELKVYETKINKKQLSYLCGRFAAKEAIIKCISDYENPHMLELEIMNNQNGKPIVKYKNYHINLSISHENNYTVAIAILNSKKNSENDASPIMEISNKK